MGLTKELYQETIEKQLEIEAEKLGLTIEDLIIMRDESDAQEQAEREAIEADEQFINSFQNI